MFMGQDRLCVADLETKQVKMLNFLGKEDLSEGFYKLLKKYQNKFVVEYSTARQPASVFVVTICKSDSAESLDELLDSSHLQVQLLEQV